MPLTTLRLETGDACETRLLAAEVGRLCRPGDVVVLVGEMGSGKTVFAQGFGQGLGVDEPITSPTFTLVNSYDTGRIPLHHADLYRLDLLSEVVDLALGELAEGDGVLLVEWGKAVADLLGDHLEVAFDRRDDGDERRSLTVRAVGSGWTARWPRLEAALAPWRETAAP